MASRFGEDIRLIADGQGYFLILLVLSILSYFIHPTPVILRPPFTLTGLLLIAAGLVLAYQARTNFLESRTTLSPYESPSALITGGPFRFSRNPVYLAMAMILLGGAVLMGTLLSLLFTALFIVIIDRVFIPFEEQMLEDLFGTRYREYRQRVRRWI